MKKGDIVKILFRRKPETPLDEEFNSSLKGLFCIKEIYFDENYDLFPVGRTTRIKIFLFKKEDLELAEEQELCQTLNDVGLL